MKTRGLRTSTHLAAVFLTALLSSNAQADLGDPDPARLVEAQLLALEVGGGLRPSEDLTEQILGDLAAIRSAFPGVADITHRPSANPYEILIQLTDEAQERLDRGEFHELDDLNDQYGLVEMRVILSSLNMYVLRFDQVYNTALLAQIYAGTPGLLYAEPNYAAGDGSTISGGPPFYTFYRRWGDCPVGCTYEESWTFSVVDGSVTVFGEGPDFDEDGLADDQDNCPFFPNPGQEDDGGLNTTNPDGLGTACQCGDVDDDGWVGNFDIETYRHFLADPNGNPLPIAGLSKGSVIGGPTDCDIADVVVLRRALATPSHPPGIAPVCEAALGP